MSEVVRVAMKAMRMMLGEQNKPGLVLSSFSGSFKSRSCLLSSRPDCAP